ncbi:MAG: S8 family serine peptidase [Crocinitomicaceae bacterium]|nr:S8 family serine peptidase [Crocinitomicaceae bacterium]
MISSRAVWLPIVWVALVTAFHTNVLQGQTAPNRYWVQFEGKEQSELAAGHTTSFSVQEPERFLSDRALQRRANQSIVVTAHDLPIAPSYIAALAGIEEIQVILKSKWFNAVTVQLRDTTFDITTLLDLPMVSAVKSVVQTGSKREPMIEAVDAPVVRTGVETTESYGQGWEPLVQLHGQWLHGLGFRGQGMWIAILDAGFENAEHLPIFERMRQEGRMRSGLDAMNSQGGLYAHHRHGTAVLGTIAGNLEDSLIGTAPESTFWLYRTEDAYSEYLIEEDYWVAAAEHADSIGVDLINTSLGYSQFDDSTMNHVYADLNGITTRISQATSWAAEKGMLCVTSAGNSGSAPWHFITAPADAEGILTVGAVDLSGEHAAFSGWGPTADGRVKPDVMALGVQAAYPFADGTIRNGNGTSFSSPILCGVAACLWQAFPEATAHDIRHAIISSAHLAAAPNDSMGNGIPDMRKAFKILDDNGAGQWEENAHEKQLLLFPNPSRDGTIRWIYTGKEAPDLWRIRNARGQLTAEGSLPEWTTWNGHHQGWVSTTQDQAGIYFFQLLTGNRLLTTEPLMINQ